MCFQNGKREKSYEMLTSHYRTELKGQQLCWSASVQTRCYGCDWITNHYEIISGETLTMLRKMGGQTVPITGLFPYRLYKEIETSTVAVQVSFLTEVTEQIVKLFDIPEKWDTRKLDDLQNVLANKQLKGLKRCAEAYPATERRPSALRRHFKKLKRILKKANYSHDSWVQIRAIVKTHLERIHLESESRGFFSYLSNNVQTRCYGCKWITNHYRILSGETLTMLRKIEEHTVSITGLFPYRLYMRIEKSTVGDQVRFLAEVTEQIVKLFDHAEKWDTRELNYLQNILESRQLAELKHCAEAYPATRRSSKLRKHFRELRKILHNANYSHKSWERIRAVVKTHLERMDIIADHLRRSFRS
ncbi:hypothetical protein AOLI_G00317730 [Acnodon oligacanthus]